MKNKRRKLIKKFMRKIREDKDLNHVAIAAFYNDKEIILEYHSLTNLQLIFQLNHLIRELEKTIPLQLDKIINDQVTEVINSMILDGTLKRIGPEDVDYKTAFNMAAGLLSTMPEHEHKHPEELANWLLQKST